MYYREDLMGQPHYVRVNFMLPEKIYLALKTFIPERKRSQVVADLLKEEIEKREKALYKIAQAVEKDTALNREMKDWDVTLNDGLEDDQWK